MSLSRLKLQGANWSHPLCCARRLYSSVAATSKPQYPPIVPNDPLSVKLRRKEQWHNWLKSHETVEEKLFELNMPKYYGWHSVMIEENSVPYDFLPYAQYATRTHLEIGHQIQHLYSEPALEEKADKLAKHLRSQVEDVILFEHLHYKQAHDLALFQDNQKQPLQSADAILKSFLNHLNRILLNNLTDEAHHLQAITVVPEPRLEAFWFLGGINPSQAKLEDRRQRTKLKDHTVRKGLLHPTLVEGPVNEPIQYIGQPLLHVRGKYPLPLVEELLDSDSIAESIPCVPYEPKILHLKQDFRHATTIPGFWPGDAHEFGLVSFHSSNYLSERPPHFGTEEHEEAMHSSAILASYAWLLGQACYQGFSTFQDPTYPLSTQTVMTNGKDWSFYLYQLNTTLLHTNNATKNPRCNLCWGTKPMALYDRIEDGRVTGLNENVLKQIIKLYLLEAKEREGVQLKPYLGEKPHVADIDYEERREWLERNYKELCSNRPRHMEKPEMYAWEYLYKVKYRMNLTLPRRRWFELQQPPPDCRRLDEHHGGYIPKPLRTEEHWLDRRKFYKQFFPGTNKVPETLFYHKPKPVQTG